MSLFCFYFSAFEKDDTVILSLLDVGFNRVSQQRRYRAPMNLNRFLSPLAQCIMESPHFSICCSELRQILHSITRPQNVIATQQALYAALQRARDIIIITDDALRIQYTNKTTERILGLKVVSQPARARSIEAFAKKIFSPPPLPPAGRNCWSPTSRSHQFGCFSSSKPNQ